MLAYEFLFTRAAVERTCNRGYPGVTPNPDVSLHKQVSHRYPENGMMAVPTA